MLNRRIGEEKMWPCDPKVLDVLLFKRYSSISRWPFNSCVIKITNTIKVVEREARLSAPGPDSLRKEKWTEWNEWPWVYKSNIFTFRSWNFGPHLCVFSIWSERDCIFLGDALEAGEAEEGLSDMWLSETDFTLFSWRSLCDHWRVFFF